MGKKEGQRKGRERQKEEQWIREVEERIKWKRFSAENKKKLRKRKKNNHEKSETNGRKSEGSFLTPVFSQRRQTLGKLKKNVIKIQNIWFEICRFCGTADVFRFANLRFVSARRTEAGRLLGALLQQTKVLTADELKVTNNIWWISGKYKLPQEEE